MRPRCRWPPRWPPRTALVTGASSGIGRALAVELGRHGARVALVARRRQQLDDVAEEVRAVGGSAVVRALDVGRTEEVVAALEAIDDEVAGLDLVIANAGVGAPSRGPQLDWPSIEPALRVNLLGAAATLTAVLPRMVARRRGHLVAISSLASFGALPGSAVYCAPKAGLSMLMECLRLDLLGSGVVATTVHVGFVRTPMVEASEVPMPMMLSAEEAASRIVAALPQAPPTLDFPAPMAALARALSALPRPVRDAIARRVRRSSG